MNTSETEEGTGEIFSYLIVLLFFKNSFVTLSNLNVTAKKRVEIDLTTSWLVPIHLNATALIAYQNNRADLHVITFHILTTEFTKGFTQPVSHSSCLLLIVQKLPGHSSRGADTLRVSTPGIQHSRQE